MVNIYNTIQDIAKELNIEFNFFEIVKKQTY